MSSQLLAFPRPARADCNSRSREQYTLLSGHERVANRFYVNEAGSNGDGNYDLSLIDDSFMEAMDDVEAELKAKGKPADESFGRMVLAQKEAIEKKSKSIELRAAEQTRKKMPDPFKPVSHKHMLKLLQDVRTALVCTEHNALFVCTKTALLSFVPFAVSLSVLCRTRRETGEILCRAVSSCWRTTRIASTQWCES